MDFKKIDFKKIDLSRIDFNKINLKKLGRKRIIYVVVFIAVVAILAWAFIAAEIITRNFNREQLVGTENRQELDISSIILTETKGDKKYWEIYGEKGYYNSDNKVALLENVAGNFYKNNEVSMSFESSQGTYNEVKKQIILYNNTYVVIKDGTTLNCDRLTWSGSDSDVIAKGNVKVNKDNELLITADKVIINPDYSDFKIIGKTVTKLYKVKEQK